MSNKTKKLALKKESLRNLSEAELGQVGGGTYVMYVDYNRYIMKQPVSLTSKTDTWNNYYFYYGY
ncbi:MAG TPA: class I lanthipeptide [Kofleriaceae bacterium]|nr:class I lanthipeptide [Kofleriaceae bacterium]